MPTLLPVPSMSAVALDFLLVHHAARRLGITSGGRSEHQNCAVTMGLIALLARLRWNPAYQLAWLRIATGRNLQHKRFFRDLYGAYEAGLDANLALLHEKLIGGWKATPPMRIYLPKASGLLRPITLLAIEDQIVLQAIANRIASHLSERRRKVDFIIRRLGKLPLELSYLWRSHAGCGTPLRSRTSPPISTFLTPAPSMKSHLQPGISHVPQHAYWSCVLSASKSCLSIFSGTPSHRQSRDRHSLRRRCIDHNRDIESQHIALNYIQLP